MRSALLGLVIAAAIAVVAPASAQSQRYTLAASSRLVTQCVTCDPATAYSEPITGSFDVGVLPTDGYRVDAVTGVAWTSGPLRITGTGFLQRFDDGSFTLVIDARFNGTPVLLTSERTPRPTGSNVHIDLRSPRGAQSAFLLRLVAEPERSAGPDEDADGISDAVDNCPATASSDQSDADGDRVGDACDRCPDTPLNEAVLPSGCALPQACPCEGPLGSSQEWAGQRQYVQCVARTLKTFRVRGQLSRAEIRKLLQDAVRSGCGRRVLAMN